jgi:arylsulfatase A
VLDDGYKDGAVEKLGAHEPAGPFSGGKYSVLEGGTRTPFITRWSGHIKPGVSDKVVCTVDLAASFAALAGAALPANACLDSLNVLPALLGESGAKGRDHLLQQDNSGANFGLRAGDWKLVRMKARGKTQARVTRKAREDSGGLHRLYHLPDDAGETKDVSAEHPEKLKEMIAKLDAVIAAGRSRE